MSELTANSIDVDVRLIRIESQGDENILTKAELKTLTPLQYAMKEVFHKHDNGEIKVDNSEKFAYRGKQIRN